VKAFAAILFAWMLVWSEGAAPSPQMKCADDQPSMSCAGCCCCAREASTPSTQTPLAPVPSRPANAAQFALLLLPTIRGEIILDRAAQIFPASKPEVFASGGAVPLFQRDCAILI
jgi:hypothetical protein